MEYTLLNDGNPNDEGYLEAVIENNGNRISTFKAKTERELLEKVLDSQVHANREIARLRKPDAGRTPLKVEPRELSAADRLRISTEITDPSRVVEAIEEVMTARQGISPDKLGAEFARQSRQEQDDFYAQEAQAFRDDNLDFYPVPQNRDAIFEELRANGWPLTRNNLTLAFNTLKERGNLIEWPTDARASEPQHEGNQPVYTDGSATPPNGQSAPTAYSPRPRTIATTGLRNADASALPPPPPKRKQQYTRADIERMSRSEYNEKLQGDPDFRRQVDAMA